MKNPLLLKVAVLMTLLSALSYCFLQAQNVKVVDSAQHFVEDLYAQYGRSTDPPNLFERNADQAFTSSLIALSRADAKAAKPDVGVLDYDPVCNCQDPDVTFLGLKISIESANANRAIAIVEFTIDNTPNKILLTLLKEKNHWRIFNIEDISGAGPHTDLRTMLKNDIRELSKKESSR